MLVRLGSMAPDTKACTKCGEVKASSEFSRDARSKDGLQRKCRVCDAAYYAANAEKVAAHQAAYRAANPEKLIARNAAYRAKNPEKRAAQQAACHSKRYLTRKAAKVDKIRVYLGASIYVEPSPEKRQELLLADYERIQKLDDPQCSICEEPHEIDLLFVDHDPRAERVRGLLCPSCRTQAAEISQTALSARTQ